MFYKLAYIFQYFEEEKFHTPSRALSNKNVYGKHLEGEVFMNNNWIIKFLKIFPLEIH